MALGAQRADVLRLVMRQTVSVVAIGLIGVALALAAARLIEACSSASRRATLLRLGPRSRF